MSAVIKALTKIIKNVKVAKIRDLLHSAKDLEKIARGKGTVKLYHGAPKTFAEKLVARVGTRSKETAYQTADDMLRHIAKVYEIPYTALRKKTGAGRLVDSYYEAAVHKLSTAPAGVATGWAESFPYGEILSTLNTRARLYKEAIRLKVPYNDFYKYAWSVAAKRGMAKDVQLADALRLPDRLAKMRKGGALVELNVDIRAIPKQTRLEARIILEEVRRGKYSLEDILERWNTGYKDIKIAPQNIKTARIVGDVKTEYKGSKGSKMKWNLGIGAALFGPSLEAAKPE